MNTIEVKPGTSTFTRAEVIATLATFNRAQVTVAAKSVGLHVYRESKTAALVAQISDVLGKKHHYLVNEDNTIDIAKVVMAEPESASDKPKKGKGERAARKSAHPVDDWSLLDPTKTSNKAYVSAYNKGMNAAASVEPESGATTKYAGNDVLSRRFRAWWLAGWHSTK